MNDQYSVTAFFRSKFGQDPEILIRSAGRINLIGEHIDYNDGFVLPAAIDKFLFFAARRNRSNVFRFYARDMNQYHEVGLDEIHLTNQLWANYLIGIIQQFLLLGKKVSGIDCVFGGNIPIGAGVSSSAALEGGFSFVLNQLFEGGLSRVELARLSQRSSNTFVGVPTGIMDQFSSLMGKENQLVRIDCKTLDYAYFPFHSDKYTLVLLNSKVSHSLAESAYGTRVEECRKGLSILKRFYPQVSSFREVYQDMLLSCKNDLGPIKFKRCDYVVKESQRVLEACDYLESGKFEELGRLMYASHAGLRDDYEVSCEEIDFLVDFATQRSEVAGARIMGGGFGGCTINLVEKHHLELFKSRVSKAYMDQYGIQLDIIPVHLSDGTMRLY